MSLRNENEEVMKLALAVLLLLSVAFPSWADINTAVTHASAITSGSTQDITVSGFGTVSEAWVFTTSATSLGTAADGANVTYGMTDGTRTRSGGYCDQHGVVSGVNNHRSYSATNIISGLDSTCESIDGAATVAFITDGIRLTWSNFYSSARLVVVVLFGGSNFTSRVDNYAPSQTLNGSTDVTAPGFLPTNVFLLNPIASAAPASFAVSLMGVGVAVNDGSNTQHGQTPWINFSGTPSDVRINRSISLASPNPPNDFDHGQEIKDFDSSGFSAFTRLFVGGSPNPVIYSAQKYDVQSIKLFNIDAPVSIGAETVTGIGFKSQFAFVYTNLVSSTVQVSDSTAGTWGFTILTPTTQYSIAISSEDGASTTNTQTIVTNQAGTPITVPLHNGSTGYAATFGGFNSDGWTWTYSDVKGAAVSKWFGLAVQDDAPLTRRVLSFD